MSDPSSPLRPCTLTQWKNEVQGHGPGYYEQSGPLCYIQVLLACQLFDKVRRSFVLEHDDFAFEKYLPGWGNELCEKMIAFSTVSWNISTLRCNHIALFASIFPLPDFVLINAVPTSCKHIYWICSILWISWPSFFSFYLRHPSRTRYIYRRYHALATKAVIIFYSKNIPSYFHGTAAHEVKLS